MNKPNWKSMSKRYSFACRNSSGFFDYYRSQTALRKEHPRAKIFSRNPLETKPPVFSQPAYGYLNLGFNTGGRKGYTSFDVRVDLDTLSACFEVSWRGKAQRKHIAYAGYDKPSATRIYNSLQ